MDLNQHTLFGNRLITSVGYNEQQIIRDILHLHCNGKYIDCDPTYSVGNFYKHGLPSPKFKFDIKPQAKNVIQASADNLPIENNSIDVLMFDPPFLVGKYGKSNDCRMSKRFSIFPDRKSLLEFYENSLNEFYRILKPKGVVIFKNQDVICSDSYQLFTHCHIYQFANSCGFYVKDLFILIAKQRINNPKHKQSHARKFHSYFFVLIKK